MVRVLGVMDSVPVRILRQAISLITVLTVLGACASSIPLKQTDLVDLIEDMEKKAYIVRQFKAEFVKKRSAPVFDKEMEVSGTLVFQKPGKAWLKLTGDINVEILSDGRFVKMVHDNTDEELYRIRGDRDLTKFADPLMLLIHSVGNGGLRKLSVVRNVQQADLLMLEIDPRAESQFERIRRVFLWLTHYGEIKKVNIVFRNGGVDETLFTSWALLDEDGPEIRRLNERLKNISDKPTPTPSGDRAHSTLPLARNDPYPEPFVLRKPMSEGDLRDTESHSSLTMP